MEAPPEVPKPLIGKVIALLDAANVLELSGSCDCGKDCAVELEGMKAEARVAILRWVLALRRRGTVSTGAEAVRTCKLRVLAEVMVCRPDLGPFIWRHLDPECRPELERLLSSGMPPATPAP